MRERKIDAGLTELRAARRQNRLLFWAVGLFSFFVNLLMLTGPIYMLQVYDRVLGSRSVATLVALTALVAFLYAMMALLDYARGRIMARVGARFQARMERRVFDAVMRKATLAPDSRGGNGLRDLDAVQRLLTAPVLMAVFDLPWTPVFLVGILVFHPWLGYLAIAGGATLIVFTALNQVMTAARTRQAAAAGAEADAIATQLGADAEMVQSMGIRDGAFARWHAARGQAASAQLGAADVSGSFSAATRAFRLLLQSAMLGLGALLVLRGELTPGAMIAGSILLGRALAPVELAIGQWPLVQQARQGWHNLAELLAAVPPEPPRTALPRPRAHLRVKA